MAALHLPPLSSVSRSLSSSGSRSLPLCSLLLPTLAPPSSASRFQSVQQRSLILQSGPFNGLRPTTPSSISEKRKVITHASSEIDGSDLSSSDVLKEGAEESVSIDSLPLETKLQLMLKQKLKMKLAKKIRLRRKRLLRKRKMRKKGRWPPSKMKKNKNV